MAVITILLSLVASVALAFLALGVGRRIRRLLALPVPADLRLPVELVIGLAALAVCVLILGLAHVLSRWTVAALLIAAFMANPFLLRIRTARWRWRPVLPGLLGAIPTLLIALSPPFFYDALVYHLGLPWQALLQGGFAAHPEDVFSTFPPLAQGCYCIPLAFGLERVPAMLHWFLFVAAATAAGNLARLLGARRLAADAVAFSVPLLPVHVLVPGFPAAEGWLLAPVLLAVAAAIGLPSWRRAPLLAGLLAGLSIASRLQGIAWAGMIVCLVAVRSGGIRPAVVSALAACAAAWPWWGKNWLLLGAPFAPIGWSREGIQTLWRDSGSILHSQPPGHWLAAMRAAIAPHARLLVPLGFAAVLPALARGPDARRARLVLAAALVGLPLWLFTGSLPRFAAPSVTLIAVCAAAGTGRFSRWTATLSLAWLCLLGTTVTVRGLAGLGGIKLLEAPPSQVRSALVMADPFPAFTRSAAAAGHSTPLPPGSKVLFVGEPRGFGFPRPFIVPSQHDVNPIRDLVESTPGPALNISRELRRHGYTHILINASELHRLADAYPVLPWATPHGRQRWYEFVRLLGPPVVAARTVAVFALPADSPRTTPPDSLR